jgi:hypothetical protein
MRVSDGDDERAVLQSQELVDQLDLKEGDDLSMSLQCRDRHEQRKHNANARSIASRRASGRNVR